MACQNYIKVFLYFFLAEYPPYDHMDNFGGYMKPEKDMDPAHMHDYDDGYAAY